MANLPLDANWIITNSGDGNETTVEVDVSEGVTILTIPD